MQALIYMTLFGILLATTGGLIGVALDSSTQLIQQQVNATKQYFEQVEFIMTEHVLADSMELPTLVLPEDIFLLDEVQNGVLWQGENTQTDLWRESFEVLTATDWLPVVSTPGGYVTATVQAFALVSSGPDKQFDADTQSAMNAAQDTINDYTDVTNLAAVAGGDDIVHTFNTATPSLQFWNQIDAAVERLAFGLESYYSQELKNFNRDLVVWLQDYYDNFGHTYVYDPITGSYSVNVTDTSWLALVDTKPTMVTMTLNLRQIAQDVADGLAVDPTTTLYELPDPVGMADALNFLLVESGLTMLFCNASATVVGCNSTGVNNDMIRVVYQKDPSASSWNIDMNVLVNEEIEF